MTEKRKISYEQSLALDRGRDIAHSNAKRRAAARQARESYERYVDAERAEQEAREREQRAGFDLGARVTGRDRTFSEFRTGTVIAGPPSERGEGVWIRTDEGLEWVLGRYSVKPAWGEDALTNKEET